MSDLVRDAPVADAKGPSFQYPFAPAPDVIRAHQKDAYFQGVLLERLSSVLRTLYGAPFAHTYASEARTITDLIYLGLTTFVGNRTLGEEYTDIVQVEDDTLRLPSLVRRGGYIVSSILLPYSLTRLLPSFRRRLRAKLEHNLHRANRSRKNTSERPSWGHRLQTYIVANLDTLTSPAPIYALSLAIFYFTGAYYHLSKRLAGLRYIFTRRLDPAEQRGGYEVLGVLLSLQLAVQAYTHVHSMYHDPGPSGQGGGGGGGDGLSTVPPVLGPTTAVLDGGVEVSLDPNAYSSNNALLLEGQDVDASATEARVRRVTHTPAPPPALAKKRGDEEEEEEEEEGDAKEVRYNLADESVMGWIEGRQQRKCTLCLEPLKDPSVTTCGHVFCWSCIRDWLAERAECPLCRQGCTTSHVLPLRC